MDLTTGALIVRIVIYGLLFLGLSYIISDSFFKSRKNKSNEKISKN